MSRKQICLIIAILLVLAILALVFYYVFRPDPSLVDPVSPLPPLAAKDGEELAKMDGISLGGAGELPSYDDQDHV